MEGVPWWLIRLRICYCNGSGHCCNASSIPGLGTSVSHGCGQKKKKIDVKNMIISQLIGKHQSVGATQGRYVSYLYITFLNRTFTVTVIITTSILFYFILLFIFTGIPAAHGNFWARGLIRFAAFA